MKHIFTVTDLDQAGWLERVPETVEVLLTGQPFSERVRVFVPIGYLNKSEDLAEKMGTTVHGRRWGTITRNDGHYIEVTTEEHDDESGPAPGEGFK